MAQVPWAQVSLIARIFLAGKLRNRQILVVLAVFICYYGTEVEMFTLAV